MLMGQIAPRLRSAIPKCVHPVGAEDAEELIQDAITCRPDAERSGTKNSRALLRQKTAFSIPKECMEDALRPQFVFFRRLMGHNNIGMLVTISYRHASSRRFRREFVIYERREWMARPRYYTPQLDRDLVASLYHAAKAQRIPMTRLASSLVREGLVRLGSDVAESCVVREEPPVLDPPAPAD